MQASRAKDVDFSLSKDRIDDIKSGAKFAYEQGLLSSLPDIDVSINQEYLLYAKETLS